MRKGMKGIPFEENQRGWLAGVIPTHSMLSTSRLGGVLANPFSMIPIEKPLQRGPVPCVTEVQWLAPWQELRMKLEICDISRGLVV